MQEKYELGSGRQGEHARLFRRTKQALLSGDTWRTLSRYNVAERFVAPQEIRLSQDEIEGHRKEDL